MMDNPPSFEQWQLLAAVVDEGGFAQAADKLCKSQSAVSYGIKQLQLQVGVPLLEIQGRKAVLTDRGELLLKRARALLQQAEDLQLFAERLGRHQPKLSLSVESLLPTQLLISALGEFVERYPNTQLEIESTVLSGGVEALLSRRVDMAVVAELPPGFLGSTFINIPLVLVASPAHPLAALSAKRELGLADLVRERQIVIKDSGLKMNRDAGWLGANRRITVSNLANSMHMVSAGLGFAWLPLFSIIDALASGQLQRLRLQETAVRRVPLYIVHTQPDGVTESQQYLARALVQHTARWDESEWLN